MNWTLVICCSAAVVAAFLVHGSAAHTRVGFGQLCRNTSECTNTTLNSVCNITCQCKPGYQYNGTNCTAIIPNYCKNNSDCHNNFQCITGLCKCQMDLVNNICKRRVSIIGGKCDTATDVCWETKAGHQNVQCKGGKCTCKKGKANKEKTACSGASSVLASIGLLLFTFLMSRN